MAKYKSERDFVQQEFMKNLDPINFILKEDKDNYYIVYIKKNEDTQEEHTFITLYKDQIQELMKEYEKEYEEDGE